MRQFATAAAAVRQGSEAGFTLIEVIVVATLLAVVLIGLMGPLDFAQQQAPKEVEYAHSISEATNGLQTMMREIRQAYRINGTNADPNTGVGSMIDFFAVIGGRDQEIEYDCSQPYPSNTGNPYASQYYRCLRVSVTTGGSLPSISSGSVVIDRILSPNLFTFYGASGAPNTVYPTYVEANVQVPARGPLKSGLNHPITLDNATAIPNLQNGS